MRICVFQPDFPHNLGGLLRLGVCFDIAVDVIEPCGFPFSIRAVRQSGLDYADRAQVERHASWSHYLATHASQGRGRLVLLTTRAETSVWDVGWRADDVMIVGRESAGAPEDVHAAADIRARIPISANARSLNVVAAAAIALGEASRQQSRAK